jgi:hypothetical protein
MLQLLHCNIYKEIAMFTFEDQYKKVEQLAEHYKLINEFWIDSVLTSIKKLLNK